MANSEQVVSLWAGVKAWNKWRKQEPNISVDLSNADLSRANLSWADLSDANLDNTDLSFAKLSRANLFRATLRGAKLMHAELVDTDLTMADLRQAELREAYIHATLHAANLSKADLTGATLTNARLYQANLTEANLDGADLSGSELIRANLTGANLTGASLAGARLVRANLTGANLFRANLDGADLSESNLRRANLSEVSLARSNLVQTRVYGAKISNSNVYGVNVWDLKGKFKEQKNLTITLPGQSPITVDNIKVAQFIYLMLNNKEIRDVIDALTSKAVLILGRFAIPERKAILDALRDKLREYDLLPIVFDFDRPTDKDFTETIKTLAGMCYFVIADVTNPKSSPLELQATVPDYQIPFVPIIQEGEYPFAMMVDLQKKYNWVLDTISYDSLDTLIEILKPHIIDPAIRKRDALRIIKAKEPTIISGRKLKKKR